MSEENAQPQEKISYTTPEGVEVQVPIYRAGMPEVFVALQPPTAQPYIMAARDMPPQQIVDFFVPHVQQVEELRADMLKRFAKTDSEKCRYMTGDVAYVMGRPFQLRVYPLGNANMKKAARGRATAKFSIDAAISLITLYVVHPRNYDEAKLAFNSYAEGVILRNATGLVSDFMGILAPGAKPPVVRMRAMRDRWTSDEAGALWLSTDLIPYPPDCLVYPIWRELEKDPWILLTQIGEYGTWAKMRFVLKNTDHVREARDAALRAVSPYTHVNASEILQDDGIED